MKQLFYFLGVTILIAASCEKQNNNPAQYYIRCKIDGQDYFPNNCANCMKGQLLGDTTFLLNANAGYESVAVGIIKLDKTQITEVTYALNNNLQQNGVYDNSPQVNDIYKTDAIRVGELKITTLDKANKIIASTFYFQAFNPIQNKTVNVSNGEFRLKYTEY
jgi:hypothetical protein